MIDKPWQKAYFFQVRELSSSFASLDMLGYLYVIGTLSVIVVFVDDGQLESYRKLLMEHI